MKRLCGLIVVAAFAAVGCNRAQEAPAPATAAFTPTPHGSLKQVMQAIPFPASNIIFDMQTNDPGKPAKAGDPAGGATAQYGGIAEYAGWNAVVNAGVALQETANLIMIPGRLCENGRPVPTEAEDFRKWAANLADAGDAAYKAAQSKNLDAIVDVAGTVSDACAMCHEKYRDKEDNKDRCM